MDCTKAVREAILERYVAGTLAEDDREAFERHYFGCARCFDELQTIQAIRDELPRLSAEVERRPRRTLPVWIPAALAATLILAVGGAIWMRPVPVVEPEITDGDRPPTPNPSPVPQPPSAGVPRVAVVPSLEQLARFEPPVYEPPRLRGAPDEATADFLRGMDSYRKADYNSAVADLRRAADRDLDAPHIHFFLGIAHLALGQNDAAIARLRGTIALGDSPYLEDAHFYLAKALLARKDLAGAEAELNRVIQLRGQVSDEATRLLGQVRMLRTRSD
jgi:tetratricopeptide (TPR) repeat protein